MLDIGKVLLEFVLPIGVGIIALYYIIEFSKSIDEFNKLMRALWKNISKLLHLISTHKRRKYDKVLASKDFLDYQREVLYTIYDSEIDKINKENNEYKVEKVSLFGQDYEAIYIDLNNIFL